MKTSYSESNSLKSLTQALVLGVGLSAGSAFGQSIIEVGGAATIGDTALTAVGLPATGDTFNAAGDAGNVISGLISTTATVITTGNVSLSFDHRYFMESGWDGGAVFVSINGGAFTYLPAIAFSAEGYVGDTTANAGSAWITNGEDVFYGKSTGYDTPVFVTSVADLGPLTAGDTIAVEFRGAWDGFFNEAGTDWEISTVTLTDAGAADILDVDFVADGVSGFTVMDTGPINNPWTYLTPTHAFEIDGDLLTADRYTPSAPGGIIDIDGANFSVSLLAGTLDIGDSFTLFDLSGGATLTGTPGSLSLPGGTWDTSLFDTTGVITVLDPASPLIYEPFADLDSTLSGNTPGLGLTGTWGAESFVADGSLIYGGLAYSGGRVVTNPGDQFQQNGISPGTTLSDAGLLDDGATLWFSCLIVKSAKVSSSNDRRVYVSLGTGNPDGFDRIGGNSGSGFTVAVNKISNTGVQARLWNDGSDGAGGAAGGVNDLSVADGDTFLAVGKITWGAFGTPGSDVFELYLPDEDLVLGPVVSTISADFDQNGLGVGGAAANAFDTIGIGAGRPQNLVPEVDEIRFGATYGDVTPLDLSAPELVSTSPADEAPDGLLTQQIATFNEPVFVGVGDIRIVNDTDVVTTTIPVGDPQIVVSGRTLTITPTVPLLGNKAYHIEIDAGAVTNYNLLDYAGILNATDWNFIADGTDPTLASITDSVSPLPNLTNTTVTYTVTFDEAMIAGTVDTSDFANGGSAGITVDSVTATVDPAVYEVVVTTLTAGDLTLEIVASAVITDLSGNALDTTVALPDDTTITVNDPAPTAASLANDFQGTIASEQHPTFPNEARYFHVSVNAANPGTGSYAATIVGTNTPAGSFVRNYTGLVEAYAFGSGANSNLTIGMTGGPSPSIISFTTEDDGFDGFAQAQAKVWDATDPGALLATDGPGTGDTDLPYIAAADKNSGMWRSLGGAVGTVDISSLASGSIHIYYGAFSSTPTVKVTLKDTDNVAADIVLSDVHSIAGGGNGDAADRSEYYLAEIDFVTDGFYDEIEFEWLANGTDYTGNGRGLGVVVTGPDIVATNDFVDWIATFPGVGGDTGFDDDADADGNANGLENFFGTDPSVFSAGLSIEGVNTGAGTFTFSHPQNPTPADDVSAPAYTWSTDLATFTADGAANAGTTVTFVATPDTPVVGTTTVVATVTGTAIDKLFVRVGVTNP